MVSSLASDTFIHDRDPLFTEAVRGLLRDSGVKPLRLPANSPNLNAYAERFVLSIRRVYSGQRDHLFRGKAITDSWQADRSSKRGRACPSFRRKRTYLSSKSVHKGRLGGGSGSGD